MKYKRLTDAFVTNEVLLQLEEKDLSPDDKCYIRLTELEDKIENGTLVELPCKVGDTVYCVESRKNVRPYEKLVLGLEYYRDEERHYWQIWTCDGIYGLGEDIFLHRP